MSKLKIDLDVWAESALHDDPDEATTSDLTSAAQYVSVMLEGDGHPQQSIDDTLRKHPGLVGAYAISCGQNRLESSVRTLKIEELRLLENIANSLESIARAAASPEGKSDE
mgnify:FL=1